MVICAVVVVWWCGDRGLFEGCEKEELCRGCEFCYGCEWWRRVVGWIKRRREKQRRRDLSSSLFLVFLVFFSLFESASGWW